MSFGFIWIVTNCRIPYFKSLAVFYCAYKPWLPYICICLGCCDQHFSEYGEVDILIIYFISFDYTSSNEIAGLYGNSLFILIFEVKIWFHHLKEALFCNLTIHQGFLFLSYQHLSSFDFLMMLILTKYYGIAHCDFHLHVSDNWWF